MIGWVFYRISTLSTPALLVPIPCYSPAVGRHESSKCGQRFCVTKGAAAQSSQCPCASSSLNSACISAISLRCVSALTLASLRHRPQRCNEHYRTDGKNGQVQSPALVDVQHAGQHHHGHGGAHQQRHPGARLVEGDMFQRVGCSGTSARTSPPWMSQPGRQSAGTFAWTVPFSRPVNRDV